MEAHRAKMEEVLSKTTPKQFKEENMLREKYNLDLVKDPKEPKRPLNRFLFYIRHLREIDDPSVRGLAPKDQASIAAKKFKTLTEEEAKVNISFSLFK